MLSLYSIVCLSFKGILYLFVCLLILFVVYVCSLVAHVLLVCLLFVYLHIGLFVSLRACVSVLGSSSE